MTPRQQDALAFISGYIRKHDGVAPSYDEIKAGLGIQSKSGVARLVRGLEAQGRISVNRHRARSIRLVEQTCPHCGCAL